MPSALARATRFDAEATVGIHPAMPLRSIFPARAAGIGVELRELSVEEGATDADADGRAASPRASGQSRVLIHLRRGWPDFPLSSSPRASAQSSVLIHVWMRACGVGMATLIK